MGCKGKMKKNKNQGDLIFGAVERSAVFGNYYLRVVLSRAVKISSLNTTSTLTTPTSYKLQSRSVLLPPTSYYSRKLMFVFGSNSGRLTFIRIMVFMMMIVFQK